MSFTDSDRPVEPAMAAAAAAALDLPTTSDVSEVRRLTLDRYDAAASDRRDIRCEMRLPDTTDRFEAAPDDEGATGGLPAVDGVATVEESRSFSPPASPMNPGALAPLRSKMIF